MDINCRSRISIHTTDVATIEMKEFATTHVIRIDPVTLFAKVFIVKLFQYPLNPHRNLYDF